MVGIHWAGSTVEPGDTCQAALCKPAGTRAQRKISWQICVHRVSLEIGRLLLTEGEMPAPFGMGWNGSSLTVVGVLSFATGSEDAGTGTV